MATVDPAVEAHREWLGFVQSTGLVVSPAALVRAGAILPRHEPEGQRALSECVAERALPGEPAPEPAPCLPDFHHFAERVLGWNFLPKYYIDGTQSPIPPELEVPLPDHGETLRPDIAVREPDEPAPNGSPWQLLVRVLEPGRNFDLAASAGGSLELSPHGRMERLLRGTGTTAGLLCNSRTLRLLSAPRGESSGWLDFHVADMVSTMGRPIASAMGLLLGSTRLLSMGRDVRLTALLHDSRAFQNEVSERLAEQVLHALYELLRGFQTAHDASRGELLREPLAEHPDEIYRALLTVILRLVFLLYAEERGMLPDDETFLRHYSLASLHERLREDAALHPDTMDQRYGAWGQLLALFRMVHDGAACGALRLPARRGALFDPDRFPCLEGRPAGGVRQLHERIEVPLVPDGTIWRALEKLLVLDGERISYRALDVEQIGSVYETMMGFRLEKASGRSLAIRSAKRGGAPTAIDLDALLGIPPAERGKWIEEHAGRKPADRVSRAVKAAAVLEDLHAALEPVLDRAATPDLVPPGAMVLQPTGERRSSGAHYTPRALTEPIVRETLEPILASLRSADDHPPRPGDILALKVCDPAMGSGAFLVEACRQLGDALVEAWHAHDAVPVEIPPDEDEVLFARRLVAQRCLYGVDRNALAVDLAKVSLWLATLAKEHPLTFVDHALRDGDSLVGLSRSQIQAFNWEPQMKLAGLGVREHITRVAELRKQIREAGEEVGDMELRHRWEEVQTELDTVRLYGDLVVTAFFEGRKPRKRELRRAEFEHAILDGTADRYRAHLEERREGEPPLAPFHWESEFPEVFDRERPGFDAIVGNPPFQGGRNLSAIQGAAYAAWLSTAHENSSGGADLVAHFYRRAFDLLRGGGAFGLIATNTIAQGDTRATGLRWICRHGGEIYSARRRVPWPGRAAVVVSVVHVAKGPYTGIRHLDNREVERITAFLFPHGDHEDPARLAANRGKSFIGSYVLGLGFTFDDTDKKGVATPIAEMEQLLVEHPHYSEAIFPYIGGKEVNTSPTHAHHRFIIHFGERTEGACRRRWPDLMAIVEAKVRPERAVKDPDKYPRMVQEWWKYWNPRPELHAAIAGLERVLVTSRISSSFALSFLPAGMVYNEKIVVFPFANFAPFALLQSRVHEVWARTFSTTLKDDLQYTPSDCFETFPFPVGWETHPRLEVVGKSYYERRAALMEKNDEGLTKTYNRFHDPEEHSTEIAELRELHAAMDRSVLEVYGWSDVPTDCKFLLDHEIDDEEEGSRRRKPWRYRWPDEVQGEVLARLLELNAERAKAEERSGIAASKKRRRRRGA